MNKKENLRKLRLERYALGRDIAALKVIHFVEENDEEFSSTKIHTHDFYELVVVMKGKGIHQINNINKNFNVGHIFLLQPKDCHRYFYNEQLTLLTFMFNKKVLNQFKKQLNEIPKFYDLFPKEKKIVHNEAFVDTSTLVELDVLLNNIAMGGLSKLPGANLIQIANFINALVLILQNMHNNVETEHLTRDISVTVSYMLRNYQKDITLKELAKMANMSVSSFIRKFKNDFDESPINWLLRLRIRKAMNFLSRSDMTIGEVASNVGFVDSLYFSRQFKKFTGYSPKEFRSRNYGVLHTINGNNSAVENTNLEI